MRQISTQRLLAMTAFGATTSVGWDVVTAAASIRAGLMRPRQLLDPEILDDETHELVPVVGHPIQGLTDGFVLFGRWLRLARTAVEDLLGSLSTPLRSGFWERSLLLLATPVPDEHVFLAGTDMTLAAIREQVGFALLEDLQLPISHKQVEVVPFGHIACAAALQQVAHRVGVDCDRALVVAVDSLMDPLLVENLAARGRLKYGGNPVGLSPGEAAVALLVESARDPARRIAKGTLLLRAVSLRSPAGEKAEQERRTGCALTDCIKEALDQAGIERFTGDVYLDLNGEPWRAQQWGMALTRIQARFDGKIHLPTTSVGDIGAASGALGVCLSARAFARRYARAGASLVVSAAETGSTACIALETHLTGGAT